MCSTDFVPPSHRSEDCTTAIRISASTAIKMFCSLFTASRKKCKKNAQKSVRKKPNPKKITKRKNNKKIKPPADKQSGISFYYFKNLFCAVCRRAGRQDKRKPKSPRQPPWNTAGSSRIGPLNSRWQTKRLKWRQCIPPKGRRGTRGAFLQRERAQ